MNSKHSSFTHSANLDVDYVEKKIESRKNKNEITNMKKKFHKEKINIQTYKENNLLNKYSTSINNRVTLPYKNSMKHQEESNLNKLIIII